MSVARCRNEIDSEEFAGWLAFNRIDPWTSERDDIRAALTPFHVGRMFGGTAKLDDYVPSWAGSKGSDEDGGDLVEKKFRAFVAFHNQQVKRGKGSR